MTSWEVWLARAEVEQEEFIECTHARTEMRRRRFSNGSISFMRQCLECGSSVGLAVAQHRVTGTVGEWDDGLRGKINQAKKVAFQKKREGARAAYWAYLQSPEWAKRRALVMERANGLCEGCRSAKATQVHHLTYAHVFEEFLFDLVALCARCHERLHDAEHGPEET